MLTRMNWNSEVRSNNTSNHRHSFAIFHIRNIVMKDQIVIDKDFDINCVITQVLIGIRDVDNNSTVNSNKHVFNTEDY